MMSMLRNPLLLAGCFLMAAATVAAAPLVRVDEPAVCLECHPELGDEMTGGHAHAVFAAGQCSDCHNPHASKHASPWNADLKRAVPCLP